MSELSDVRLSTRRELELMQHLQQLANHRAQEEKVLAAALATQLADAERDFGEVKRHLSGNGR